MNVFVLICDMYQSTPRNTQKLEKSREDVPTAGSFFDPPSNYVSNS